MSRTSGIHGEVGEGGSDAGSLGLGGKGLATGTGLLGTTVAVALSRVLVVTGATPAVLSSNTVGLHNDPHTGESRNLHQPGQKVTV